MKISGGIGVVSDCFELFTVSKQEKVLEVCTSSIYNMQLGHQSGQDVIMRYG